MRVFPALFLSVLKVPCDCRAQIFRYHGLMQLLPMFDVDILGEVSMRFLPEIPFHAGIGGKSKFVVQK